MSKLRVYAISDQDDAGPWLRREFPALRYIAMPSTQDGEEYYLATWTGISGDRFYRNAPGADFTTFSDSWVNANVRAKGPLGKLYPYPCCIHEGDTPSFLGLIDNGLASAMSPAFGGWGGRYVWRQPRGETRPFWTQGGDSYPGNDSSRDTVMVEGKAYTSDQATIWRWRTAFQHDFAARMDWTIAERGDANHNPTVVVNGKPGNEPLVFDVPVGTALDLDAAGTADPDGQPLTYTWLFYPEAASGIPGHPVRIRQRPPAAGAGVPGQGDIPSAPVGGPREPPPRLVIENASGSRATRRAEGAWRCARDPRGRGRRDTEPDLVPAHRAEHEAGRRIGVAAALRPESGPGPRAGDGTAPQTLGSDVDRPAERERGVGGRVADHQLQPRALEGPRVAGRVPVREVRSAQRDRDAPRLPGGNARAREAERASSPGARPASRRRGRRAARPRRRRAARCWPRPRSRSAHPTERALGDDVARSSNANVV